jgi:hypothetical protein
MDAGEAVDAVLTTGLVREVPHLADHRTSVD